MKNIPRVVVLCLLISLICMDFPYAAFKASEKRITEKMANAISDIESPIVVSEKRLNNERTAITQYNDLIKGMQSITKTENVYLDSYGGAYIDDNGDLVVCITESSDRALAIKTVKTLTKNPDIETKVVKYSLNYLLQVQDEISSAMVTVSEQKRTNSAQKHIYYDLISDITTVYISETNNVIVVKMSELTEQKVIDFKKAFPDINCVVFEKGGINSTTTYIWRPGRALYDPNRKLLSTGYPVYFTDSNGATQRGFITAGHTFDMLGMNYNYAYRTGCICASCLIAEKVRSQFCGTVDATLMRITDSDYQMTDITFYGQVTLVTNSYILAVEGATVYKEGATTGQTQGRILSLDGVVNYGTTTVYDLIVTSALNLPGDSGGVMYSAGNLGIIGSMSGSSRIDDNEPLTSENFEVSYASAVANTTNALNCTVWNY